MAQTQLIPLIIAVVTLLYVVAIKIKIPAQLVLILGGVLLGLLPALANFQLDPFVVFNLLAPPLLYGTTVMASVQVLRFNLFSAVLPVLLQFVLTIALLTLLTGWLIPGLNWAGALLLGVIAAASGDVFRALRQPLRTPRRVEEFLEVENLVTPAFLVTLLIIALQFNLNKAFSLLDALAKIGLDLGVGSALGVSLGLVLVWLRRQIAFAPVIEIGLGFGTPYLLSTVAGLLGITSLPVVIAGGFAVAVAYFRRPASERGVSSLYRIEANGFWLVINLLLGGITLFLIGLGLPGAISKVQASYGWEIIIYTLLILVVAQLVRFGVAYATFHLTAKAISYQTRPVAEALVVAWSGARSFFAVLMVLVLPVSTPDGQPFGLRNLFVVLVCLTTLTSLALQGLTLPWLVRRLKVAGSPDMGEQEKLVRSELASAALQRLQNYNPPSPEEQLLVENLQTQYLSVLPAGVQSSLSKNGLNISELTTKSASQTTTLKAGLTLLELRKSIVAAKASALRSLRQRNLIADEVLARFQLEIDLEAEWLKSSLYTT